MQALSNAQDVTCAAQETEKHVLETHPSAAMLVELRRVCFLDPLFVQYCTVLYCTSGHARHCSQLCMVNRDGHPNLGPHVIGGLLTDR